MIITVYFILFLFPMQEETKQQRVYIKLLIVKFDAQQFTYIHLKNRIFILIMLQCDLL